MADLNGALQSTLQNTIQGQVHRTDLDSLDIFNVWVRAGELLPPYWCRARDIELSRFWHRVDHVSSAFSMFVSKFASIPVKVIPRDMSIKTWVREADNLTANLNGISDYGQGWANSFLPRFIMDYLTQDNGGFAQIIGDAPMVLDPVTRRRYRDYSKPREGFYGLTWLDSQYCQRTSNPVYPVIYQDIQSGSRYKLHYSRVMYAASMSSPRTTLNGIGFCSLSRMINTAQHLWDISTAEQEELGSRPKRRLIVGKQGITAKEIRDAMSGADTQMDNEGLRRYSKSVVIASSTKPTSANAIEIDIHDLNQAMRGDDKEKSITLAMFLIALSLNIPPRWLWPATSTGATKADAMFQHIAGMGGGVGYLITLFKSLLGGDMLSQALGKPIGPQYEVVFDYQDDEQDRQAAEIRELRSKTWTANINTGVINERVAREQALDAGDLTEQQFDDLELGDGRLPDGTDVLNLFMTTDPELATMLAISVGDVLNVEANDRETVLPAIEDKLLEVRAILQSPDRPKVFDKAKWAFAALMALKTLYTQPTIEEQQEGLAAIEEQRLEEDAPPTEEAAKEPPKEEEKPPTPPPAEKGLNFMETVSMMLLTRKERPPVINVTMPDITMPEVSVALPEINITLPEQTTNVTVPERSITVAPAQVENRVTLPAPVVKANINIPQQERVKEAPPVIHFNPQVNVPETVVNVTPEITVNMPEVESETTHIERDENGLIKLARKLRIYKR